MLCPLHKAETLTHYESGTTLANSIASAAFLPCVEGRCAWWSIQDKCCAINVLPAVIRSLLPANKEL